MSPADVPTRRAASATLALALLAAACGGSDRRGLVELSGPTMGTTWSVTLATGSRAPAADEVDELRGAIDADLARVNALMSTWDAESELSRFNRSESLDPIPISAETFEVFRWAQTLSADTGGAFDVTVGPLVDAWGFGAREDAQANPDETEIARLRARTGMRLLTLDPEGQWIRKGHPGVRCDFSAIAPGYAADRLAALLTSRGFGDFLVDVGGELVARGHNENGARWRVAVERPNDTSGRSIERVVALADAAIATSGDYRNYHEIDGVRMAHILDPRTGRPIAHRLASVTVIDRLAVRADALATALMVLGPDEGLALADRLDLAALLVVRRPDGGFETRPSVRFDRLEQTP